MAIELYWGSGSPFAWRVMLTLEVKGLAYESKLLEFSKGENKAPAYLLLNPRGKVPTLKDGDFVLYESLAIMSYLDRKYPDPPLFGKTPEETGLIWRALAECESYVVSAGDKVVRPIGESRRDPTGRANPSPRAQDDRRALGRFALASRREDFRRGHRRISIGPTALARCVQRSRPAVEFRLAPACANLSQRCQMGAAHRSATELPAHLPAALERIVTFNVATPKNGN